MSSQTSGVARDANHVPVIAGLSSADLSTPLAPKVISSTNRLAVDSTTDAALPTTIVIDGTKTTSGTNVAVQLIASSTPCKKVALYAYTTNSDTIAVGTSTVFAESSSTGTKTGRGEQLLQGGATSVYISDASLLWVASAAKGDGVSFVVYT